MYKIVMVLLMIDRELKTIAGFLSAFLAISLLVKLLDVPGGMILSGLFLESMLWVAIILGCLVVAVVSDKDTRVQIETTKE